MTDFSFLSDSDDDRAVEQILSQAMDHSVLEQVAAINCSSFTSDSVLPTQLETRFSKLKSFPLTKPKSPFTPNNSVSSTFNSQFHPPNSLKPQFDNESKNPIDDEDVFLSPLKEDPVGKKEKSQPGFCSSPPKLSDSSGENSTFKPSKQNPDGKMGLKSKSRTGSFLSPSNSWSSSMESPSPPQRTGCFWCSPKSVSRKKSKENRVRGIGLDWEKGDEFLSNLSTFSEKEQQKILKKAMKEEEKINREAEKIVKWAKQASARMDVSGLEDEPSDTESTK